MRDADCVVTSSVKMVMAQTKQLEHMLLYKEE